MIIDLVRPAYRMNDVDYRPVSRLAVASLIGGLISLAAFFEPALLALAAVAMILAVAARRAIQRYQLLGTRAVVGSWYVAVTIVVLAPSWHLGHFWQRTNLYESEAQPNHRRLDFADLVTGDKNRLEAYENQRICLKGYFVDGDEQVAWPAQKFSATGDPKDQRAILVIPPSRWKWNEGPVAVSGLLRIDRSIASGGRRYILHAAAIRESKTMIDLAQRKSGFGGC